jgi:hypothetical protein
MLTDEQIIAKYGQPGDASLQTICTSPFPMRIAWKKNQTITRFQCHKLVKDRLEMALKEILDHYGLAKIKELGIDLWGGCLNVRLMRGSKSKWSRHAWGIAIDLDPERNGLKTSWAKSQFSKPEYRKMIEIFEKYAFVSYGKSKGFDSMHFETTV